MAATALGGLTFSILALRNALVNVIAAQQPEIALRISPADADALVAQAEQTLQQEGDRSRIDAARSLALRALTAQPLNAAALRILGYARATEGNRPSARAHILAAARLSRRDLGAQFWLIEDRVLAGDVSGALEHYDVAMRTHADATELLVPHLSKALDDPVVQDAFAPYVRSAPYWLPALVTYAGASADPRPIVSTIVRAGGLPAGENYRQYEGHLITSLIDHGFYNEAKQYYLSISGAVPAVLTSTAFSNAAAVSRFGPLTWELKSSSVLATDFVFDNTKRKLLLMVDPDLQAPVARKVLFLIPGAYQFRESHKLPGGSRGSNINWSMACLNGNTQSTFWEVTVPAWSKPISQEINVPINCPIQSLSLLVASAPDQEKTEIVIDYVGVSKIRGTANNFSPSMTALRHHEKLPK